ncbi:hypothetical protein BpHYR1_048922 [Brachionus plicatilis]|uniref:Uncharacterized protein n=1 Tax=Brachionus plicatilis TaxID=10195 RepID=A0A3M7PKX4_BRAPC|nr:hypothetical protein BpHYR1_048922 [Brachionus plicatilis]
MFTVYPHTKSVIINKSSAYTSIPVFIPSISVISSVLIISFIRSSTYIENSFGERGPPCFTPIDVLKIEDI